MKRIIKADRSVIVAADVPNLVCLPALASNMKNIPGVGGFKIGLTLALVDLKLAVRTVKENLGKDFPVILDYQKAGNDIPEMGGPFAQTLKEAGVDAAILFPFAGPATQEAWTKACFKVGLGVLTGGIMTHKQFLVSEGGFIADDAPERIYNLACDLGVRDFVVPGTKIDWVIRIRRLLVDRLGGGNFVLYAPGFITQGGDISECGKAAGDEWHAIVGSAIYGKPPTEQMQAALDITRQIVA